MASSTNHPRIRKSLKRLSSKMHTLFALSAPPPPHTGPKSPGRLETDLKNAVRAEPAVEDDHRANHPYGGVIRRNYGINLADGVWICVWCTTENTLVHYTGDHPFKYLRCRDCEHVYNRRCPTSDILTDEFDAEDMLKKGANVTDALVGFMCSACGLTHRGQIKENCPCGDGAHENWIRFVIGSNFVYRQDPDACLINLKVTRAVLGVELHTLRRAAMNRAKTDTKFLPSSPSKIHINTGRIGRTSF